jgi:hypothetical protein
VDNARGWNVVVRLTGAAPEADETHPGADGPQRVRYITGAAMTEAEMTRRLHAAGLAAGPAARPVRLWPGCQDRGAGGGAAGYPSQPRDGGGRARPPAGATGLPGQAALVPSATRWIRPDCATAGAHPCAGYCSTPARTRKEKG